MEIDDCKTPTEAWGEVHHFISNKLLLIAARPKDYEDATKRKNWRRMVIDAKLQLIGALYSLSLKMLRHDHSDDAEKILGLANLVAESDVSQASVRTAIDQKLTELDPFGDDRL